MSQVSTHPHPLEDDLSISISCVDPNSSLPGDPQGSVLGARFKISRTWVLQAPRKNETPQDVIKTI